MLPWELEVVVVAVNFLIFLLVGDNLVSSIRIDRLIVFLSGVFICLLLLSTWELLDVVLVTFFEILNKSSIDLPLPA